MEIIVFEKEAYYKMLAEVRKTITEALCDVNSRPHSETSTKDKEWVTLSRAKEVLKCGREKLRDLWGRDEIVAVRDGRQILYFEPSLFDYLSRRSKRKGE